MLLLLIVFAIFVLAIFLWQRSKKQKRKALLDTPLTDQQRAIVAREVPMTQRLPSHLQRNLEGRINLFLDQVDFIGCAGLDITEEMELSIAAQASLLVVNSDAWYENLRTALIYPGAFRGPKRDYDGYVVTEGKTTMLGQSWPRGPVVLSWAAAQYGANDERDGHNVVLHEFAHQLDDLSGRTDAVPVLSAGQSYDTWEQVFLDAFERHRDTVERGQETPLDAYGAEAHQEFFAVAIEAFFEKPKALKSAEPDLYEQISQLLRLDPLDWNA